MPAIHHVPLVLIVTALVLCGLPLHANALVRSGTYAWGDVLGWVSFPPGRVTVTDTRVTGYAWSSTYGWINLSPSNGGVTNTREGVLGGSAWSSQLGWIPFTGVRITEVGVFTGIAGSAALPGGRLSFDCTRCHVTTDWRPIPDKDTPDNNAQSDSSARDGALVSPKQPRLLPPLASVYEAFKDQFPAAALAHRTFAAYRTLPEHPSVLLQAQGGVAAREQAISEGSAARRAQLPLPLICALLVLSLFIVALCGHHLCKLRITKPN
jgi:hypothetical protein